MELICGFVVFERHPEVGIECPFPREECIPIEVFGIVAHLSRDVGQQV